MLSDIIILSKKALTKNKHVWVLDKGASKVTSLLIDPLFSHIISELKAYLNKENGRLMISGTKKDKFSDHEEKETVDDSSNHEEKETTDNSSDSEGWKTPRGKKTEFIKYDKNPFKKDTSDSDADKSDLDSEEKNDVNEVEDDEDDYKIRSVCKEIKTSKKVNHESKKDKSDEEDNKFKNKKDLDNEEDNKKSNKSLIKQTNVFENLDKLKNPHKYHKDLTVKERDSIIKQSVKIMSLYK